uniref:Ubiquitin-like domain-containing protein n=1 Tax=Rhizochromulina marina TaxID=1034831 RepID=A0A7S2WAM6_9STRA
MPPKKKGKKKKAEDASASGSSENKFSALAELRKMAQRDAEPSYVTLDLKLMNWDFMNSTLRVKTSMRLFQIKDEIQRRHGLVKNLVLCKGVFSEVNELKDDMATLEDLGFPGAMEDEKPVSATIYYDFKAQDHDDPLLLVRNSKGEDEDADE